MNELEQKALDFLRNKKLSDLKRLPKEELSFKNNILIYRAISDDKYSFFKYLISIKEVKDIFDIKHAFFLTINNTNDNIFDFIFKMSYEQPIVLNKKDNTYLLEKLLKYKNNNIQKKEKPHFEYIDYNNLSFSKSICISSFFNQDLYYLNLMCQIDKEQFFNFCSSTKILQNALNNVEKNYFSFNNKIFQLNPFFYEQIFNYAQKFYRDSNIEKIKFKINANLIQLKMKGF